MEKRNHLSSHILPTSATMVGVCMTIMGLAKLVERATHRGLVDELMAYDALVFLVSAFFSYLSIRTGVTARATRLERIADGAFMAGLTLMTAVAFMFAYELH